MADLIGPFTVAWSMLACSMPRVAGLVLEGLEDFDELARFPTGEFLEV